MLAPFPQDYIYDIEVYPNVFTCDIKHVLTGDRYNFEYSYRRNQLEQFVNFLYGLRAQRARMVGFNNLGYDYLVVHYMIDHYLLGIKPYDIYTRSDFLLNAEKDEKFGYMVWEDDRYVEQMDLYKIHHFDNRARATGLKMLEFNMRSRNIEDLPFPPGTFLEPDQIDELIIYNGHDTDETEKFYYKSLEDIYFRADLSKKYGKDFTNHNDTKIGKDYFIMELEKAIPGSCYTKVDGRKTPRQTWRPTINLNDVIFPYIKFTTPEFQRVRDWLASRVITETKGVFNDLSCTVNGFKYDFGTGGIHGSVEPQIVEADDYYTIIDLDVTSYYPSIGIVNRIYPEHLSEKFCDIYENLKKQRVGFKKGTPENKALKLALNGTYGDSNSVYSPLYDPMYTMKITVNGQLLLCLLSEYLAPIPGLTMIQINTDGLTVKVPRIHADKVDAARRAWESYTGLELEEAVYSRMFIRDVNNYIAEYEGSGKLKNKGAYEYDGLTWNKNFSSLVVPKAAEAALVHGRDVAEFIYNHADFMDFMRRTKVPRNSRLVWGNNPMQNITRYYISTDGHPLTKIMPPLANKKKPAEARIFKKDDGGLFYSFDESSYWEAVRCNWEFVKTDTVIYAPERKIGIDVGWLVNPCNDITKARWENLNYNFYIQEANKLIRPIRGY